MDDSSLQNTLAALKAADAAGNVDDARQLAGMVQRLSATPQQRSTADKMVRGVAAPVFGLGNSIAETIGAIPDAISQVARGIGLPNQPEPGTATRTAKELLMPGGGSFRPEGLAEKTLYGVGHGVGDAGSMLVPGAAMARGARAGSLTARVGESMAAQPALQTASGATGGAVGETTDNPYLGMAASLAVPVGAAGGQLAGRITAPVARAAFPQATEGAADQAIGKTFKNVDLDVARKRLQDLVAAKEPVSLYQLGDESTKRLARTVAGTSGEATDIVSKQMKGMNAGASERVRGDVNRAFKGDDIFEAEQTFLDALKSNADESFGKFRQAVPYLWSSDLGKMFNERPSMKEAIGSAMRNAAEEGKPFGITRAKDGKFMTAEDFQKGEAIQALTPDAVIGVKKALDGIIEANKNEFTGALNNYGRLVNQTKKNFIDAVETADKSGLYKVANAQYAGDAEVVQALRDGKDFSKMDPREISKFMAGASFAEKDAFRTGMQNSIEQSVMQGKGDKTKALFRKDELTDLQLKAALDPKDYKLLKRRIDARKQGFEDRQFISPRTGSQTQLRQGDADNAGQHTAEVLSDVARGGTVRGAIMRRFIEPMRTRAQGVTEKTAPIYANKLFESDPVKLRDALANMGSTLPTKPINATDALPPMIAGMSLREFLDSMAQRRDRQAR